MSHLAIRLTIGAAALLLVAASTVITLSLEYSALWLQIQILIGATTLLLVVLIFQQSRAARVQHRFRAELNALMEGTPQVLFSVDAHGVPRFWNDRLLRSVGMTAEKLRASRLTDLFAAAHRPQVFQALYAALTDGICECEIPLQCGDKSVDYAWVFCRNNSDTDEDYEVSISGRDISDRSAAQRELRESESRYRGLFEQVHDAVYSTEHDRVADVNAAAIRLVGYSHEELIGMPVVALHENRAEHDLFISEVNRQGGDVSDFPIRLRRKDGTVIDCLATAHVRRDADGRPAGFHGIVRDVSERKRFLEELRRSESEYRSLFENALDAIIIMDPVTEEVLDANARACELYGFKAQDFIGRSMLELSVEPERGRDYAKQTLHGTGRYLAFESKHHRSDGTVREIEIRAGLVSYKSRVAILSINRDVTNRRDAERKVRESEERFRLLLENVTDHAIFMLDPVGQVVSWNEGAERITGFAEEEIVGRSFAVLYPSEQVAAGAPQRYLDVAAVTGRSEHEDSLIGKDGRLFPAAVTLTRVIDESGTLRGFALVTRDITERKRLEDGQREMLLGVQSVATEWTKTFDAVGMPIILMDEDGLIRRANEAARRLANRPYAALIHCRASDLEGEPWRTIEKVADFYRTHQTVTDARAEDPATRRVFHVASTAVDLDGDKRLIIALHELTLLKKLEESLRQTEITAALGAVIAGVAHEVRNPLFTISATLDSWEARMGETPESRRYLDPLRQEIDRLNTLMRELLDYGRPHELNLESVSILSIIQAAVVQNRVMATQAKVEVVIDVPPDLSPLSVDEGRMQQVFRNLIENAVQHSPAGSTVKVHVRENASGVVAEVIDRGTGLTPTDIARAFVPFYTRRKGGTGLGLSIVRRIVIAHGGEIFLRKGDEGGTVVTIRIPRTSLVTTMSALGF